MSTFKTNFSCDVCGEKIQYPLFRIEWGYSSRPPHNNMPQYDFIQVCHEDCSYGIKETTSYPCTYGDIIFDQCPYSAESTEKRLDDFAMQNPNLSDRVQEIKAKIIE